MTTPPSWWITTLAKPRAVEPAEVADNQSMTRTRQLATALVVGVLLTPATPALAAPHWQVPLWFEWFSPEPASVDPLEGKTGGIIAPGMTTTTVQGSLASTGKSRVAFQGAATGAAAPAPGSNLPAFRKPEHPKRPEITKPETPALSWGGVRHPRPPAPAKSGSGNGKARAFTPTERPLLTLPSGKEAWNIRRPDGRGTIDIKNPRPGKPKPKWGSWERP